MARHWEAADVVQAQPEPGGVEEDTDEEDTVGSGAQRLRFGARDGGMEPRGRSRRETGGDAARAG